MEAEQVTAWGTAVAGVLTALLPLLVKGLDVWMTRRRQAQCRRDDVAPVIPRPRTERTDLPLVRPRRSDHG